MWKQVRPNLKNFFNWTTKIVLIFVSKFANSTNSLHPTTVYVQYTGSQTKAQTGHFTHHHHHPPQAPSTPQQNWLHSLGSCALPRLWGGWEWNGSWKRIRERMREDKRKNAKVKAMDVHNGRTCWRRKWIKRRKRELEKRFRRGNNWCEEEKIEGGSKRDGEGYRYTERE